MGFMSDLRKKRQKEGQDGTDQAQSSAFSRHELRSSINTLKILCELISKGYRFDDAAAPENIEAMRKAVAELENHFNGIK